ncbi:MAG: aminodeoxychorismate/anthranilate synthase component II [Proteobacteria bacterium ST_bin15]|nr:MAG: aminodeoxychorismate/anthranilate synthase component II [Proteobacteria bacterium ST_bin15]
MILVIDNYDSFTFNLVHYLGELGAKTRVERNDALTVDQAMALDPEAIVISPGPCTPSEAGISLPLVARAGAHIPLFGVCLGHQAIGQAFGGSVVRAPRPMHGKTSRILHRGRGVFAGINGPFEATRYHSLIVARDNLPTDLDITAESDDGIIMGFSHRHLPIHGVQFHPESIASAHGHRILKTFLELAARWNAEQRADVSA